MTLDLMRKFNKHGAIVFNTYQAYLKSTPDTLQKHLDAAANENFTLGLKLVRGAYLETDPRQLIHDTKQNTDDAYNGIAQGALNRVLGEFGAENGRPFPSVEVLLAGHNMESVRGAHMVQQQRIRDGLPVVPLAFAQLHGMSDRVSFQLLQMKDANGKEPEVYKCSTWGSQGECIAYLARRAMENRDAAGRTLEEYTALKAEVWRRLRSPFAATA
jgi:hypothetical protein